MGRWVWAVGVCTVLLLLAQVAPSATAAPPVCSPPEQGKCIPTPDECATGNYNGHWDRGGAGRQAECQGGGGQIVSYSGGDANVPCGVIVQGDRTVSGSRARDPNLCFPPDSPAFGGTGRLFREAVSSRGGVVAAQSPEAAAVGIAVLDRGGNAMDAAVATVFAVGVTRPEQNGIGGSGFLVYRSAGGETAALDFRATYPAAVTQTNYDALGQLPFGHKEAGVPGTVAGMAAALDRFGSIPLAEAIAPAEQLARAGIRVSPQMHDFYFLAEPAEAPGGGVPMAPTLRLRNFAESARIYLDSGAFPPKPGSRLPLIDYADSLKLIAEQGPDAFYRGRIAQLIAADMERSRQGAYPGSVGLMTAQDLASYQAKWRDPLTGSYRGHQIVAAPPPSEGGVFTLEALNILEGFDLRSAGHSSADHLHLLAEAQKLAWADRTAYIADPDYVQVPTARLISKDYAASRRAEIDRERAKSHGAGPAGSPAAASMAEPRHGGGHTTHVSVIDADGNAASVTNSVGNPFGSAVVAPGTGFPLNDQLGGAGVDKPEGGKRPRTTITPIIVVKDGKPVFVPGGGGSNYIPMGVAQAISALIDFDKNPAQAVDAARIQEFACCGMQIEDVRVTPAVEAELERRGHSLARQGEYGPVPWLEVAGTDLATGLHLAASDPRDEWGSAAQTGGPAGTGTCLARRSPIGPRNIGRVRLGYTRRRALRRIRPRPVRRTRRSYSWCVKRSTGRVSAVFGAKRRVQLVTTTAPAHGMRRVVPGVRGRAFRRAFPRRRRVARGIYRVGPRSARLFGLRRGRVRFVAVATRRLLKRPRALRRAVRLAGIVVG